MKKIDWTKPLACGLDSRTDVQIQYVGRVPQKQGQHAVAASFDSGHDCYLWQVDEFGRSIFSGRQLVTNAPEPKKSYSGIWANVYLSYDPVAKVGIGHGYPSKEAAQEARDPSNKCIACIRLPDFTEGEGLE